jgi:hypothetical protein
MVAAPAVSEFVRRANEFCDFVQGAGKVSLDERMVGARRSLLALYAAAMELPSVEPTSDEDPTVTQTPSGSGASRSSLTGGTTPSTRYGLSIGPAFEAPGGHRTASFPSATSVRICRQIGWRLATRPSG